MFRASPATVKWLLDNFETAEGVSLPRARMYDHYMIHSQQNSQEPVNAASFGKLVRSVFVGLKTRRLGTRGHSKYHYYGIKIKDNSPLLAIQNDPGFASRVEQITPRPTRKDKPKKSESQARGKLTVFCHSKLKKNIFRWNNAQETFGLPWWPEPSSPGISKHKCILIAFTTWCRRRGHRVIRGNISRTLRSHSRYNFVITSELCFFDNRSLFFFLV